MALSHDGFNWARIEGPHHSGALFDVAPMTSTSDQPQGEEEQQQNSSLSVPPSKGAQAPCVVFHAPRDLRMFTHFFDPSRQRFRISLSRSDDGLRWYPQGHVFAGSTGEMDFDTLGAAACCVLKDPTAGERGSEGGYWMFYEGVAGDGSSSIGLAKSTDGLTGWKAVSCVFWPSSDEAAWDSWAVGSPAVVLLPGGRLRLYYTGFDGNGAQGIGAAEADMNDLQFERVSVLELPKDEGDGEV